MTAQAVIEENSLDLLADLVEAAGEESVFSFVWSRFSARITLRAVEQEIVFPEILVIPFYTAMMNLAFDFNFRDAKPVRLKLYTPYHGTVLNLSLDGDEYVIEIEIGEGNTVIVNGVEHRSPKGGSTNLLPLRFQLLDFNRACGSLYEQSLIYLESRLDQVDGALEYFLFTPFYEGFEELEFNQRIPPWSATELCSAIEP